MRLSILGDVHAGKTFINDVPLHRRGEREKEIFNGLSESLLADNFDIHIQVGDLFDSFKVDNETLMEVYSRYRDAALARPKVTFILYPGNHDLSKDLTKVSSFSILSKMLKEFSNIRFIWAPIKMGDIGFIPWHPVYTAEEQAKLLISNYPGVTFDKVFCHCDITGDGPNLIPLDALKGHTKEVYTGHVHTPSNYQSHGIDVHVVGSMQPYSHGEDPNHERYLTLTLKQLVSCTPEFLHNKYVRLILKDDEEVPETPDVMGFKVLRTNSDIQVNLAEIEFKDFNTRNLFSSILNQVAVSPILQTTVLEKFDSLKG